MINEEHTLEENQGGFCKGYRTTDHLFILRALVNHIKVEKKELVLCFVDFRKAFDKVSHSILWMKLFEYGINGKFMMLIKSMYEQVKFCVKSKSCLTYFFKYKRGVRQGWLLSPLLFHYSLMIYEIICSKVVRMELLYGAERSSRCYTLMISY